jgi:GNAT superfamily N-acetyltransferase
MRIAFLTAMLGEHSIELTERLRAHLEVFFYRSVGDQSYISWLAKDGDTIVASGGMSLWQHPGNFINYEGRKGYIMNMYTMPEYRRRGICTDLLTRLVDTARSIGVHSFELHATKEGEPVYIKEGFKLHAEPTYRKHFF